MSKPVISIGLEASVYDASSIMTKYNIRRLSITRDNILLGIVTATDLSRYIYEIWDCILYKSYAESDVEI